MAQPNADDLTLCFRPFSSCPLLDCTPTDEMKGQNDALAAPSSAAGSIAISASPPHQPTQGKPKGSELMAPQPTATDPPSTTIPKNSKSYKDAVCTPAKPFLVTPKLHPPSVSSSSCFRCLASDHQVKDCCDLIVCKICVEYGHRSNRCRMPINRLLTPWCSRHSFSPATPSPCSWNGTNSASQLIATRTLTDDTRAVATASVTSASSNGAGSPPPGIVSDTIPVPGAGFSSSICTAVNLSCSYASPPSDPSDGFPCYARQLISAILTP